MNNRKITTILAILLFAVSQGALAQTALDTLQIKLTMELRQIAKEQLRLQSQEVGIKRDIERMLLRDSKLMSNYSLFKRGVFSTQDPNMLLRMRELELYTTEEENRIQQNKLYLRETEIKRQLEALQKQQIVVQSQ